MQAAQPPEFFFLEKENFWWGFDFEHHLVINLQGPITPAPLLQLSRSISIFSLRTLPLPTPKSKPSPAIYNQHIIMHSIQFTNNIPPLLLPWPLFSQLPALVLPGPTTRTTLFPPIPNTHKRPFSHFHSPPLPTPESSNFM